MQKYKGRHSTNLVAVDYVSHTIVNQEKWQNQWREEEVCYAKKSKENNLGNFTVVRNWWNLTFIIIFSWKYSFEKIAQKGSRSKEFWGYTCPSRCHNICNEEWCLHPKKRTHIILSIIVLRNSFNSLRQYLKPQHLVSYKIIQILLSAN